MVGAGQLQGGHRREALPGSVSAAAEQAAAARQSPARAAQASPLPMDQRRHHGLPGLAVALFLSAEIRRAASAPPATRTIASAAARVRGRVAQRGPEGAADGGPVQLTERVDRGAPDQLVGVLHQRRQQLMASGP
jgi:hypothetical protein